MMVAMFVVVSLILVVVVLVVVVVVVVLMVEHAVFLVSLFFGCSCYLQKVVSVV